MAIIPDGLKIATAFTVSLCILAASTALHAEGPEGDAVVGDSHHVSKPKQRVIVIAPAAGFIRHTLPAMGPSPERTDWGPEAGLFFGYFRKSLTAIAFPYWADANGAHVIGGAGHLDLYFGVERWYNPVIGVGMNVTRIDVKNTDRGDLNVFAPWAKAGMRFRLPVRGLSLTPYVSYLFQTVDMSMLDRSYQSALFGLNTHYHLHRRLQIALKYYYRYTHDASNGHRVRLRLISSIADHVGVFLRAEYAEQVYDKYVSVMIGPSFVF